MERLDGQTVGGAQVVGLTLPVAFGEDTPRVFAAITIRAALVKGDPIYVQADGGVADSVPEYEYRETLAKMRALTRAVEWAEAGLE